jgi:hypothetical protein
VISALTVVLGTLVLQGLTIGPLIRRMGYAPDESLNRELGEARVKLLDAAIESIENRDDRAALKLREALAGERKLAEEGRDPREIGEVHHLRRRTLIARRRALFQLRESGDIEEDVFHAMLQELDWAELAASPPSRFNITEG